MMGFLLARMVLWTAVLCVLAAASVIDLRRRIIPNEMSLFIAFAGVALGLTARPGTAWISIAMAVAIYLVLAVVTQVARFGGGDTKLIAAVSLLVPPDGLAPLLLAIALAGGVLSLTYLSLRRWLRSAQSPRRGPIGRPRHALAAFVKRERRRILASPTVPYSLAVFGGVVVYVLRELSRCSSETFCLL